ncbi:MAG TPA: hypothetical protein VD838_17280, partial [Anaeromyxobacteraceae bacterium]|nr:hypothetical protein [Anaeromyxobacteraceae bacterium]
VAFKTRIPAPTRAIIEDGEPALAPPLATVVDADTVTIEWDRFSLDGAPVAGVTYTVSRVAGEFEEGDPNTDVDDEWSPSGDFVDVGTVADLGTFTDTVTAADANTVVYFYRVTASGLSTGASSLPATTSTELP